MRCRRPLAAGQGRPSCCRRLTAVGHLRRADADGGFTLAELVAAMAISTVVLLAAVALVVPLTAGARTVQQRALDTNDAGVNARVQRDLDRQLRSATRVQYLDAQRLRVCTYPSPDSTAAPVRVWLEWASLAGAPAVTVTPVGGTTPLLTYSGTAAVFEAPPGAPADGVYPSGQRAMATLTTTTAGVSASTVVTTLPRPTQKVACP